MIQASYAIVPDFFNSLLELTLQQYLASLADQSARSIRQDHDRETEAKR
jgi:hypothetical protein